MENYSSSTQSEEEKGSVLYEETRQDESLGKNFRTLVRKSDVFYHNNNEDDDISYRETTKLMDISLGTLYQYVTQGILTPKKYPGQRPCFSRRYILEEAARRREWRIKRGWHR